MLVQYCRKAMSIHLQGWSKLYPDTAFSRVTCWGCWGVLSVYPNPSAFNMENGDGMNTWLPKRPNFSRESLSPRDGETAAMKRCSALLALAMLRRCLSVKDEVIREDTCLEAECGQNLVQKAVKTLKLGSQFREWTWDDQICVKTFTADRGPPTYLYPIFTSPLIGKTVIIS